MLKRVAYRAVYVGVDARMEAEAFRNF